MKQNLIQAYRQAPWRNQLQSVGLFLFALVVIALVAGLYLNITAQTATAGIQIQRLNRDRKNLLLEISNLENTLAKITSSQVMQERADKLGFQRTDLKEALFIVVPGYRGRQNAQLGSHPLPSSLPAQVLKPSYTQSLWEWAFEKITEMNSTSKTAGFAPTAPSIGGGKP